MLYDAIIGGRRYTPRIASGRDFEGHSEAPSLLLKLNHQPLFTLGTAISAEIPCAELLATAAC